MSAVDGGESSTLPTANGGLHPMSPDPPSFSTPSKRKRSSSQEGRSNQESHPWGLQSHDEVKLNETLQSIVEVLKQSDTDLQLLSCPLPLSSSKPRAKRAKLSEDTDEATTILTKVATGRYETVQELLSDVDKASSSVIERKQSQGSLRNGVESEDVEDVPLSELVNRIGAFKKLLNSHLRQTSFSKHPEVKAEPSEEDLEASVKSRIANVDGRADNSVLTLFGNPANPRQLFSSLQKTVNVPLPSSGVGPTQSVEIPTDLRETALPNGISATKVVPYNVDIEEKPVRTFGEVFAPRSTLPQLESPRRSRRRASNTWVDPFDAVTDFRSFPGDRTNYCLAPLPSASWLQYGGVTSSPTYWNRKPKHDPSSLQHETDSIQRQYDDRGLWLEDDAIALQGVYSSFAPSFDSSSAVVQLDSKDMVWWWKRGQKRLHALLSLESDLEQEPTVSERDTTALDVDEAMLEEIVCNFKSEEFGGDIKFADAATAGKRDGDEDVEDVLREVSELLNTLSSYQRVRHLDPALGSGQTPDDREESSDGLISQVPSDAEAALYATLKSSLVAIIPNLPPYAVAKLDGDQLADLNISKKILVENPEYHGTMEKDDYTLQQERVAAAVAASAANRASAANVASTSRAGSYQGAQAYNQRGYGASTRVQQTPTNHQTPQQYYPGRQPPPSGPYSQGHAQPPYSATRAPSTPTQRQPVAPPYPQSTSQYSQQYQRPAQNGYNPQPAHQPPASAQNSPPKPYAQRLSQPVPYTPNYSAARSASPQQPPAYGLAQPRPPYMTPGASNAASRYLPPQQQQQQQQQPPGHYASYPSNHASAAGTPYSNSAAAMTYARSAAAEQAALVDRNKSQMSASHIRQNSSTPQRSEPASQDRSVTPAVQPSGPPVPS